MVFQSPLFVDSPTLIQKLWAFVAERNCAHFHILVNFSKEISTEAAELLECSH